MFPNDFPNRFNPYIPPPAFFLISIEQLKIKRTLMENIEQIFDIEHIIYQKTTSENAQKIINQTEHVYYDVAQVLTVFDFHFNMSALIRRVASLVQYVVVVLTAPPHFQVPPIDEY